MKTVVLNIGDELLLGQVVNTNLSWMAARLAAEGMELVASLTIRDRVPEICAALEKALQESQVVLITGGLGPTSDDKTKEALCAFFNVGLKRDPATFAWVQDFFSKASPEVRRLNESQADIPRNAAALLNPKGTAPGIYIAWEQRHVFALPGVPFEMQHLMEKEVLPLLRKQGKRPPVEHKTFMVMGMGESQLSLKIRHLETELPAHIKLAYLPSPGYVRLRLTLDASFQISKNQKGPDATGFEAECQKFEAQLKAILGTRYIGKGKDLPEQIVHDLFLASGKKLSVAESCTGGGLMRRLVGVPGCSSWFLGGHVVYSYMSKERFLDIPALLLESQGAVSPQCVELMARNCRNKFGSDLSLAISGIAGPDGGTPTKPVGTVFMGLDDGSLKVHRFQFRGDRDRVIAQAIARGMGLLAESLILSQTQDSWGNIS